MDRSMKVWLAAFFLTCVVVVAASVSWATNAAKGLPSSGARYCDECAAIRELQGRGSKTSEDFAKLNALKAAYQEKAKGLASFARIGETIALPELHPECDCPCHLQIR